VAQISNERLTIEEQFSGKYCRKKEETGFTWTKSTSDNRRRTEKPLKKWRQEMIFL
jgi:hypothetical protein